MIRFRCRLGDQTRKHQAPGHANTATASRPSTRASDTSRPNLAHGAIRNVLLLDEAGTLGALVRSDSRTGSMIGGCVIRPAPERDGLEGSTGEYALILQAQQGALEVAGRHRRVAHDVRRTRCLEQRSDGRFVAWSRVCENDAPKKIEIGGDSVGCRHVLVDRTLGARVVD
jgi:hypothetical protein